MANIQEVTQPESYETSSASLLPNPPSTLGLHAILASISTSYYVTSTSVSFNALTTNIRIYFFCSSSAALCPDSANIANGMVTFTGNSVGDTATYTCNPGFELIGSPTATCSLESLISVVFSPAPPECRREYCMNINRIVCSGCTPSYNCIIKYTYLDSTFIEEPPMHNVHAYSFHSCSAALCPDSANIANGMVTFTGNSVGDTATYTCNPGFELIGSPTATCSLESSISAVFSPAPPECRREYCMNISRIVCSG